MKLSVSLPNDLVARLDESRGLVPRSTWLAWAIEAVLDQLGGRQVVLRSEAELQRLRERTLKEWEADDRGVEQALEGGPAGAVSGGRVPPAPAEPPSRRSPVARSHLPTCQCPVCR